MANATRYRAKLARHPSLSYRRASLPFLLFTIVTAEIPIGLGSLALRWSLPQNYRPAGGSANRRRTAGGTGGLVMENHIVSTFVLALGLAWVLGHVVYHLIKQIQTVPEEAIGWDGKQLFPPGRHFSLYEITMIDVSPRITVFGEELGTVRAVITSRSGLDFKNVYHETVTEREPKDYKVKAIIVWQPDTENIRQYFKVSSVEKKIAELLKTIPSTNLYTYQALLGIKIISIDGETKQKAAESVHIAESLTLPYSSRDTHIYVVGKSGMGKSTLLCNLIRQDIESGKGVGVIDPHGDLVERVLPYIPRERVKDTILFDAGSLPIAINFFNAQSDLEKDLVADDFLTLFKRFSDIGGERMDAVLRYTARSLAEIPGATFLDVYRILQDDSFRFHLIRQLPKHLAEFWRNVYPGYPHPATEQPIISRMGKFEVNQTLRTIVGKRSALDFQDIMQTKKILLCSVPKQTIGADTASIIGALLVSQFQLAALRRGNLPPTERTPFYLYIDEFQNFQTSAFNDIITEARKYQLCLTLANQKLADLDEKTRQAVQGVETTVIFRPFDEESPKFARSVPKFSAEQLLDLEKFQAVVKPGKASLAQKVRIDLPPPPPAAYKKEITEHTRGTYPSQEVPLTFQEKEDSEDYAEAPPL